MRDWRQPSPDTKLVTSTTTSLPCRRGSGGAARRGPRTREPRGCSARFPHTGALALFREGPPHENQELLRKVPPHGSPSPAQRTPPISVPAPHPLRAHWPPWPRPTGPVPPPRVPGARARSALIGCRSVGRARAPLRGRRRGARAARGGAAGPAQCTAPGRGAPSPLAATPGADAAPLLCLPRLPLARVRRLLVCAGAALALPAAVLFLGQNGVLRLGSCCPPADRGCPSAGLCSAASPGSGRRGLAGVAEGEGCSE